MQAEQICIKDMNKTKVRPISVKKGEQIREGINYYNPDQISGLKRFFYGVVKQNTYTNGNSKRRYSYDDALAAWEIVYAVKCDKKRVHFKKREAVYASSGKKSYAIIGQDIAVRLMAATSGMDSSDFKLLYAAYIEVAQQFFGKEVAA